MSRAERDKLYVCSGVSPEGVLVSKSIPASSKQEAKLSYHSDNGFPLSQIVGPLPNRKQKSLNLKSFKLLDNKCRVGIYGKWVVNSFSIVDPENYEMIVFIKRLDNSKKNVPNKKMIVPLSDVRIQIDEKRCKST